MEIGEAQYRSFVDTEEAAIEPQSAQPAIDYNSQFALEKYLEEFIVGNFNAIFGAELEIFQDEGVILGQQYPTDIGPIDILAWEPSSQSYVVMELKRGKPSDQAVGQILRYMGWVKANLCKEGQDVRGLIICKEPDVRLTYAINMVGNVKVKYYKVAFDLRDDA
jgi:restriction system protein